MRYSIQSRFFPSARSARMRGLDALLRRAQVNNDGGDFVIPGEYPDRFLGTLRAKNAISLIHQQFVA